MLHIYCIRRAACVSVRQYSGMLFFLSASHVQRVCILLVLCGLGGSVLFSLTYIPGKVLWVFLILLVSIYYAGKNTQPL